MCSFNQAKIVQTLKEFLKCFKNLLVTSVWSHLAYPGEHVYEIQCGLRFSKQNKLKREYHFLIETVQILPKDKAKQKQVRAVPQLSTKEQRSLLVK